MAENTAIWDTLAKTDPAHTKGFSRAGGFKGTAIKPIWITRRLTEQFGPCGQGWGINQPSFQVVPAEGEILVYCTVSAWHTDRANVLWGVGGDKVQAKRSSGPFCDDEAFKKAFTDAVGNAFKFLGVGADVHMGLFDDDKYVAAAKEEFREQAPPQATPAIVEAMLKAIEQCDTKLALRNWWDANAAKIPDAHYDGVLQAVNNRTAAVETMTRVAA